MVSYPKFTVSLLYQHSNSDLIHSGMKDEQHLLQAPFLPVEASTEKESSAGMCLLSTSIYQQLLFTNNFCYWHHVSALATSGDLRVSEATLTSWHTVSISWNHVVHQPEVAVCISSELLLFAIKSCLSSHSLQGKFGHNISQRKRSFFISYCGDFQREGHRLCKCCH